MRSPEPISRAVRFRTGDIIEGRYEVIDLLDTGGMGAVFLAEHLRLKRRLAIKVLHVELSRDTSIVKRFMNEAHAAGTLGHPNIVEATDMGFADEHTPYIVFEYLEGALLTEEIYRVRGMPPRRALAIARQIASALEAAHAAGIVHLDLKCDNVFLGDKKGATDHATVIDFGISKFMEVDAEITQPAVPIGTPEFMAPEQIESPDRIDHRADIYALGVCLYEMLTARRPFAGDDPRLLFHRIVHEAAPPLSRPEVPPSLEAFVFELIAKDPAHRPQSMREVMDRIERLQLEAAGERRATRTRKRTEQPVPQPKPEILRPPAPQRPSVIPWVFAMLVAGAAGGVLHYMDLAAPDTRRAAAPPALDIAADTQEIATLVTTQLRTTRLRADSIARTPILREAVATDATTLDDLTESLLQPIANETIEIFLARAGELQSVVRFPTDAVPLAAAEPQRLRPTNAGVFVEATAPIANEGAAVAGAVVVSAFIDLSPLRERVATRARQFVSGVTMPQVVDVSHTTERDVIRCARTGSLGIAALLLLLVAWVITHRD